MKKFEGLVFIVAMLVFADCLLSPQIFSQQSIQREIENETDVLSLQSLNGLIASQRFGYSVADCGDLNGDGYDDIIAGAHLTNSNTGRAYIYFGGNNMSSSPSIVLNGEAANNYFGISVANAGDVNADGYNDVIVGAYGYSGNTGRAYIYYGGYNMDNIADVVISAPVSNSFGYSVSTAGDLNGDGFSDVIVSAHTYSSNKGRAYIYYGGLIMDNLPDKTLEGFATGGFFGFSLSGAGDINGDGFSEVVVGAYAISAFTGSAYLYYGGMNMDTISDLTFTGEAASNFFGQSVAGAGDVNGDGYSDLLIGASLYSGSTGRAYIYYGGGSPDNVADVTFTGEATGNNFGRGVSGAGDVNGDGYSDILIGAQSYNGSRGRAYLYYGGVSMNNFSDMILNGEAANNYYGFSVTGGGDINGDGYKDFIVGAYGVNSNKGKVYIYKNALTGSDIPDLAVYGESMSELGNSVSDAGDLNGDGFDDYIIGAWTYGNFATGRVYIFFGSANPDTIPDLILNGFSNNSRFGTSVSGAGDVNADGYDDIIIGAPEYNSSQGRVYIYFGGSNMDTIHDVQITGAASLYRFGQSVSSAGDMNGDGFSDVIVGIPGTSSNRGSIRIYNGGNPMDTAFDQIYSGTVADEQFGHSVSEAGDVNNDGFSDVIFGAPGYQGYKGLAVILLGNNIGGFSIRGDNAGDQLGYSVSGAGDINGDGYSDVVIGAPYANGAYGKAYINLGSSFPDTSKYLEFSANYFKFGNSVSDAGDVNNDGYDDFIICEEQYLYGAGRAFIYFGGNQPDNVHDINLNYNSPYERFGIAASSGGDINSDGLDDILIGAFVNDINGSSAGAAYVYLSSAPSVKPMLISVKDVPNDQGGKVNLKWTRSSYDVIGNDMITDYLIQRSLPPGGGGFYWENIATIPATKESYYAYNDNTPFDSLSGNSGTLFYRITARTNVASNFWRSNILYGRSIDNLAPEMVMMFTADEISSDIYLNWKRNTEPDLLNYILYRSNTPEINLESAIPISIHTDSTYIDISPPSGLKYYFIIAQDIHNNKSIVAVTEAPNVTVELTMFIEGFYNANNNSQVSDTVRAYLRNIVSPFNIIDESKAVVSASGNAVLKFGIAVNGNYYLSINHRNSIETWSASGIAVTIGSSINYDLTNAVSKAFGNNLNQIDTSPLRFAIYSGDENQNGTVDLTDLVSVSNAAGIFTNGYVPTDMNGNNITDLSDIVITSNNASAFIAKIVP